MTLGQQVSKVVFLFCVDNFLILLGLLGLYQLGLYYYNSFLRIDRNTDKIDLMARYVRLRMNRRYDGRIK